MQTFDESGQITKPKPGIPCIETRTLANYLNSTEAELIGYQTLSELIGRNVQGEARGYLLAARGIVLREKGRVFRPVRNVGLKWLTGTETAKLRDKPQHVDEED